MNATTHGEANELCRSRLKNSRSSPNRRLDGKILQKKIFFNEYLQKSLTKHFDWNKNYTKLAEIWINYLFGMVGIPRLEGRVDFRKWRLVLGDVPLVPRMMPTMSVWKKAHQSC
jgi:hypothetical protein